VKGKIDGDKISFTVEKDEFKAAFSGTVDGDVIKLSGTVGDRPIEFPIKRVKE
jgi:hypothetical protein